MYPKDQRFYIVDIDKSHPAYSEFPDWFGLVDENMGGIVALYQDEKRAIEGFNHFSEVFGLDCI